MLGIRSIKLIAISTAAGLVVGLWFGVNIGKGQNIFSNPFEERSLKERIIESGGNILEEGGNALKEGGRALKDQVKP